MPIHNKVNKDKEVCFLNFVFDFYSRLGSGKSLACFSGRPPVLQENLQLGLLVPIVWIDEGLNLPEGCGLVDDCGQKGNRMGQRVVLGELEKWVRWTARRGSDG